MRFLRRLTPKSLFGRTLVILVTPLILLQVVLGYVYLDRHLESVLNLLADNIAGDMQFVVAISQNPEHHGPEHQESLNNLAEQYLHLKLQWLDDKKLEQTGRRKSGWLYDFMGDALDHHFKTPYYLTLDRDFINVHAQTPQGVLKISTARKRLFDLSSPLILIIWTTISALALFAVASIFMRNQIKPLWRLAGAAERFGKGHDVGHLRPEGATEVRKATQAFNIMRDRIHRQIHERTELLAGVSHDLRTPLTRMRLQMALMPHSPEITELQHDVASMQSMIEGFLDFARGAEDEAIQHICVSKLFNDIIQGISHHALKINLDCPDRLFWNLKLGLIKRCLTNLLLNSSRYGSQAWIAVHVKKDGLEIWVDDDGPGIAESERENVFRPFYRIDEARGEETGGTGLGLSIARDAVRRHGGRIWLHSSSYGGLRVMLRLPK
ncbi:MAG: ATP-binding protein [Alphaproteobacteria bacterium]